MEQREQVKEKARRRRDIQREASDQEDGQIGRPAVGKTDRQTGRQIDRQAGKQNDRVTGKRGKQTNKQTGR